jgi:hypothetical protein
MKGCSRGRSSALAGVDKRKAEQVVDIILEREDMVLKPTTSNKHSRPYFKRRTESQ